MSNDMQIECSGCQKSFKLKDSVVIKKLENDITEFGVGCPNCQNFLHSFYLDDELARLQESSLQRENSSCQQRREYKEKFEQLQTRLKKQYGIS